MSHTIGPHAFNNETEKTYQGFSFWFDADLKTARHIFLFAVSDGDPQIVCVDDPNDLSGLIEYLKDYAEAIQGDWFLLPFGRFDRTPSVFKQQLEQHFQWNSGYLEPK